MGSVCRLILRIEPYYFSMTVFCFPSPVLFLARNKCFIIYISHFKALGLYNFKRGFGWAYERGGELHPGGLISGIKTVSERRDKTYLRNELKLTFRYILSYIYNTFIVRHKATCLSVTFN